MLNCGLLLTTSKLFDNLLVILICSPNATVLFSLGIFWYRLMSLINAMQLYLLCFRLFLFSFLANSGERALCSLINTNQSVFQVFWNVNCFMFYYNFRKSFVLNVINGALLKYLLVGGPARARNVFLANEN